MQVESFYRWIEPPNPNLPGRTVSGTSATLQHVRSGIGPVGFGAYHPNAYATLKDWQTRCDPDAATRNASVGSPWPNWLKEPVSGNDVSHGWVPRPFLAQHRARELVYWAVDWKSYEDAEEAPSYPVDFQRTGRHIDVGYLENNSGNVAIANWMQTAGQENGTASGGSQNGAWGGPEFIFAWMDETRTQSLIRAWNGDYAFPVPISANSIGGCGFAYAHLGAFGADRNMNGVFDRGPVPRTARLRAQTVARFSYYDPILTLDSGGK